MDIILRQNKGAPLTHRELDGNFESLDSDIQSVSTLLDDNFDNLDSDIGDRAVIGELYDWGRYEDATGSSISVSGFSSLASTPTVTVGAGGALQTTISQTTLLGTISIKVDASATNPSWTLNLEDFYRGHTLIVSLRNDSANDVQLLLQVPGTITTYKAKNYESIVTRGTITVFVMTHMPEGLFLSSAEEFST